MPVEASIRAVYRDDSGRFLSRLHTAERRGMEQTAKEAEAMAYVLAPKRTGTMAATIRSTVGSSGWTVSVGTDHWQYTELGAVPHAITGDVSFFWEREGRMWHPGSNTINHPGTHAVHFMRSTFEAIAPRTLGNISRNF